MCKDFETSFMFGSSRKQTMRAWLRISSARPPDHFLLVQNPSAYFPGRFYCARTHARTHAHALIHTHSHTHTDTHRYTYTHTNTAIIADVATLHLYSGKIYTQSPCDLGSSEQPAGHRCAKPTGHCLLRLQGNK